MAEEPEDPRLDSEEEEDGGPVKSFLEHLEDLRWVLIKCGASLGIAMFTCLVATPVLTSVLTRPLVVSGVVFEPVVQATGTNAVSGATGETVVTRMTNALPRVSTFGPLGAVVISMKMALYGGMVLSLPFILFFIGQFVMPALKRHEKKYFSIAFGIGAGLFMGGVLLCYFYVLPIALKGMVAYTKWMGLQTDVWRAEEFFSFALTFMLGMGLSFEVPVLILTLVKLGLVEHKWLVTGRKYFFVINLTMCAFITPDFLSTFLMVVPVQVLMEICILISAHWERQKRAAEAALAASSRKQISSAD